MSTKGNWKNYKKIKHNHTVKLVVDFRKWLLDKYWDSLNLSIDNTSIAPQSEQGSWCLTINIKIWWKKRLKSHNYITRKYSHNGDFDTKKKYAN